MKTQDEPRKWKSFRNSTLCEYIQVLAVAFVLVFGFMRPFVVEAFKIPSASMENTLLIGDRILVAKFIYGINVPFIKLPRCSIGMEFEDQLNRSIIMVSPDISIPGHISEDLRKEFRNKGIELSRNATVSLHKRDKHSREIVEWLITDDSNTYNVRKKKGKLKVYSKLRILDFHKPAVGDIFVFKPPPGAIKTQNFIKRIVAVPGDIIELRNGNLYRNGMAVVGEDYVKRHQSSPRSPQNTICNRPGPYRVPLGYVFAMGDNRDRSSDSRVWGPVPIENIKGQAFLTYWSWNKEGDWLHKIRFSKIGRRVK